MKMKYFVHKLFWFFLNHTYKWWPDAIWLKVQYRIKMKQRLNLKTPKLYTEKLQWLKLHDRNPLYSILVDKYEVKQYVKEHIGAEYVIPTLGVWDHFDDIDFDLLPDQFVLKCTHDSGNVWICKDKSTFDMLGAEQKLEASLSNNFYWWTREWPYKNVKPRIIAEIYMSEASSSDLVDYKFYCFNGRVEYCQVISNRSTDETIDFYDRQWLHQPFIGLNPKAHHSASLQEKPEDYTKMLEIADKLSTDICSKFSRIDLYYINKKILFGEITFYPNGATGCFVPNEWNHILGDMIKI